MKLLHLKANWFRNISALDITCGSRFNLIYGLNGSGKSSVLEMIYCLGRGRSFRTHLAQPIVQFHQEACHVFGHITSHRLTTSIGLQKAKHHKTQLRIGVDQKIPSIAELAKLFPVQLIHPECHDLINHGPKLRRQFIDWSMFHVEPQFLTMWQRFSRLLKQRNAALQQRQDIQSIVAWDEEMIAIGCNLHNLRQNYYKQFIQYATPFLESFLPKYPVSVGYEQGWNLGQTLAESLKQNLNLDYTRGYTGQGPHRFDLIIKIGDLPAEMVLSRGEQKRLICSLYLAQAQLIKALTQKDSVYLLDDVMSELDSEYQQKLWDTFQALEAQLFITAISPLTFDYIAHVKETQKFYMEDGKILAI